MNTLLKSANAKQEFELRARTHQLCATIPCDREPRLVPLLAPMSSGGKKNLLDDDAAPADAGSDLRVNRDFAKKYKKKKQREELTQCTLLLCPRYMSLMFAMCV